MIFWYRLLGFTAYYNERMSHSSVNFIPTNWIAMGVACMSSVCGIVSIPEILTGKYRSDPGLVAFIIAAAVFGTIAAIPLVITFLNKYIIFRKTDAVDESAKSGTAGTQPDKIGPIGFTGCLRLDDRTTRRFLNVPAIADEAQTGELALLSQINASTTFYSQVIMKRDGVWYSVLRKGSLEGTECGILYVGNKVLPALRIRYMDNALDKPTTNILSFENEAQRSAMINVLAQTNSTANSPSPNFHPLSSADAFSTSNH